MVSRWEQPFTCYLAIKLEKFTECSIGQIVKYKLKNNKKKISCTFKLLIYIFGLVSNVTNTNVAFHYNTNAVISNILYNFYAMSEYFGEPV